MAKLYKLSELVERNNEIIEEINNGNMVSFSITGEEEYNKIKGDECYINFIKKNVKKIRRLFLRFKTYANKNFEELEFLKNENVEVTFYLDGFYEQGIDNYYDSKKEIMNIISNLKSKEGTTEDIVVNILNWIAKNIKYDKKYDVDMSTEENKEILKNRLLISYILKEKTTNCAGFSNLVFAFFDELGLDVKIEYSKKYKWHSFNSVYIGNEKRYIDATALSYNKDKDKNYKVTKNNYYITDEELKNLSIYTGDIFNDNLKNRYNVIDIKKRYDEIIHNFQKEKISFYIHGKNDYVEIANDDYYMKFLKENILNIKNIYFIFDDFENGFRDIDFKEFEFLENEKKKIRITYSNFIYEKGIENYNESKNEIRNTIKKIIKKGYSKEEKVVKIIEWIAKNIEPFEGDEKKLTKKEIGNLVIVSNVLKNRKANVAGYTNLLYSFLEEICVKTQKAFCKPDLWNIIYLENEERHVDIKKLAEELRKNKGFKITSENYFVKEEKLKQYLYIKKI